MASITKIVKTDYKNKRITIHNGKFVNADGEVIDVAAELAFAFGDDYFDLSATYSDKVEITPVEEN